MCVCMCVCVCACVCVCVCGVCVRVRVTEANEIRNRHPQTQPKQTAQFLICANASAPHFLRPQKHPYSPPTHSEQKQP